MQRFSFKTPIESVTILGMLIAVRFVLFVWSIFFVVHVIGGKTLYVGKAAMYISLATYFLSAVITRKPLLFVETLFKEAHKFIKLPVVWIFAAAHVLAVAAANFISYKEMGVNTWDLGHFIQSVYNNYHFGQPTTSVAGVVIWNHFLIHRCMAIEPLTWLYGLFGSASFFPIWQGVFLMLPGLVAIVWYKNVAQKNKVRIEPLGALLAFFVTP